MEITEPQHLVSFTGFLTTHVDVLLALYFGLFDVYSYFWRVVSCLLGKSVSDFHDLYPQIKKKSLPSMFKLTFDVLEKISDTELSNLGFRRTRVFCPWKHLSEVCLSQAGSQSCPSSIRRCFFLRVVLLVLDVFYFLFHATVE